MTLLSFECDKADGYRYFIRIQFKTTINLNDGIKRHRRKVCCD